MFTAAQAYQIDETREQELCRFLGTLSFGPQVERELAWQLLVGYDNLPLKVPRVKPFTCSSIFGGPSIL